MAYLEKINEEFDIIKKQTLTKIDKVQELVIFEIKKRQKEYDIK